ncbi:MAG: hypothetical protein ACI976_002543 [Aureispira sp.]|jgi:hypothetical protein
MADLNFNALFEAAAMEMLSAFKRSLASFRPDEKGQTRENQIRLFLKQWLPEKFGISKGYLVDKNTLSKECDIVIFDKAKCPKFYLSEEENLRIFPIAYVYCTIEVKSKLNDKELDNALLKIESVNKVYLSYRQISGNKEIYHEEVNLLLSDYEELNEQAISFKPLNQFKPHSYSGYKGQILRERSYSDRPIRILFCFDFDKRMTIDKIKRKIDRYEYNPEIVFCLKYGSVFQANISNLSRFYSMEGNNVQSEYSDYTKFKILAESLENSEIENYFQSIKEGKESKNLMFFYALLMDLLNEHYQSSIIDPVADIIALWQKSDE